MKNIFRLRTLYVSAALLGVVSAQANADELIGNGGFESGFAGWTRIDQAGSDGTFLLQSGAASPVNAFPVPVPPQGSGAAMTDATAGGSHALYQDFTVPASTLNGTLRFSLFVNSGDTFRNPATLDWAGTNNPGTLNLNQQARVDILRAATDPFSITAGDVLANLFQTLPADALVSGYNDFSVDISPLLLANAGQTLRLRFAEVDNVSFFNLGVDGVGIQATVPEPAPLSLALAGGLLGFLVRKRRPAG